MATTRTGILLSLLVAIIFVQVPVHGQGTSASGGTRHNYMQQCNQYDENEWTRPTVGKSCKTITGKDAANVVSCSFVFFFLNYRCRLLFYVFLCLSLIFVFSDCHSGFK